MKKAMTLAAALLFAFAQSAFAQSGDILHMSGEAWEDGAFPPSVAGEQLQAVERMIEEAREIQRQDASRIIVPGAAPLGSKIKLS